MFGITDAPLVREGGQTGSIKTAEETTAVGGFLCYVRC